MPSLGEEVASEIIGNALDFASRAAAEAFDQSLTDRQRRKYSTIHLFECVELMLKARLIQEHWTLALVAVDGTGVDPEAFKNGQPQTVQFDKAVARLRRVVGVDMPKEEEDAYGRLRKMRNQFVHFSHNPPREQVLAVGLEAWHFVLRRFEHGFLGILSQEHEEMLEVARKAWLRSAEFLDRRMQLVASDIDQARTQGRRIVRCPRCRRPALKVGARQSAACLVCGESFQAAEAAVAHLQTFLPVLSSDAWLELELPTCLVCKTAGACAPIFDSADEGYAPPDASRPTVPKNYLCFGCGEPWETIDQRYCIQCESRTFAAPAGVFCEECGQDLIPVAGPVDHGE